MQMILHLLFPSFPMLLSPFFQVSHFLHSLSGRGEVLLKD